MSALTRQRNRPVRCKLRVEMLEQRNLLTFYGGYRTVEELHEHAVNVTSYYPDITELVDYGDSYSKLAGGIYTPGGQFIAGYDLEAVRITNRAVPGPKPVYVLMTGLHPREITTPEIGMRFLDYLTQYYGYDPDVTWIVDHHEIWYIPLANPDGHWYVELGTLPPFSSNPWLWRKNGNPVGCNQWPGPGKGVDLNRNFADHWGGIGSSGQPCSETYRGAGEASEPEVYYLLDLVRQLIPDQRGPSDDDPAPDDTTGILIDVHTQGGYVLWPWGHTSAPPPNSTGLTDIGNKLASYNGYRAGQSYQTLYPTTGTSKGWVYTELGAPAYTIEMDSGTFLAQYSVLPRLWAEMKDLLFYAARTARAPYQLARGPDAKTAWAYVDGPYMYTYAEIDDRQNGGQNITAAEFYLDTPPWLPGAKPIAMDTVDGAFNSPYEPVYGWRLATDIPVGRHLVYMRGRDAAGNWGPFSAQFLDITAAPGGGNAGVVPTLLAGDEPRIAAFQGQSNGLAVARRHDLAAARVLENRPPEQPAAGQSAVSRATPAGAGAVDPIFTLDLIAF